MNGTPLKPHFKALALRIQQIAEQGNAPNVRIQFTVLCERGIPRYVRTRRDVIEPKSANLDWLLELMGEDGNGGMIFRYRQEPDPPQKQFSPPSPPKRSHR